MEIRPLTHEDVPAAMDLSSQAGWNQVPADWHRLLDLAPEGCLAGRVDGDLVATATLVTYDGEVGWIGMVLVDRSHRREGYGTAVFEHALRSAERRGVRVGLDATDAGRAVYGPAGFVDVCPIERWGGELSPAAADGGDDVRPVGTDEVQAVRALDERACGVDRGDLLEHLLSADGATGLALGEDPRGYAVVRPGRERDHVGPLIAPSAEDVPALLSAAADVVEGGVLIDVVADERVADHLERAGLARRRRLTRMAYREPTAPHGTEPADPHGAEPADLLVGDDVVSAAGFELG